MVNSTIFFFLILIQKVQEIIRKHHQTFLQFFGMAYCYTDIDRDGHEISRFGGLPRELYFPKGFALRENIITRENIAILAPPTRDISSVPVNIWYIRWSKWMISSKFDGALWLSRSLVTRLGVCVQNNLNANLTALRAFYYDVLLLTAAYSDYAGHFFLGQFPNMELLLLLLSLYSLLNSLYFPGWWNITLFLTGCLCALNYMSKPDHLI